MQTFAGNSHILEGSGYKILFSYGTPVALYAWTEHPLPLEYAYIKTNEWKSKTTSKHINLFFRDAKEEWIEECDQSYFDNILVLFK